MVHPADGRDWKEAMEVIIAASPTREWKAATVWGNAIGSTCLPITAPTAPPTPKSPAAATRDVSGIPSIVVVKPPAIPSIPSLHPIWAVDMLDNPPIAAMHASCDTTPH